MKNIVIHKKDKTTDNPYCMVNNEEMSNAMLSLTGSGFKLYMYLCKNQNNMSWVIREKHVLEFTGLSHNTFYKAIKELENKNYIINNAKTIDFYESPQDDEL